MISILLVSSVLLLFGQSKAPISNVIVTSEEDKPMTIRTLSDEGLEIIKRFEGTRDRIYMDASGNLTGGIGHLLTRTELRLYKLGSYISECQVVEWLKEDLAKAEKIINNWVVPDITQNQFDALVSFVFNVGETNFKRSTLLKRINKSQFELAAKEFGKWRKSKGKVLQGLVARRAEESRMFMGEVVVA